MHTSKEEESMVVEIRDICSRCSSLLSSHHPDLVLKMLAGKIVKSNKYYWKSDKIIGNTVMGEMTKSTHSVPGNFCVHFFHGFIFYNFTVDKKYFSG